MTGKQLAEEFRKRAKEADRRQALAVDDTERSEQRAIALTWWEAAELAARNHGNV